MKLSLSFVVGMVLLLSVWANAYDKLAPAPGSRQYIERHGNHLLTFDLQSYSRLQEELPGQWRRQATLLPSIHGADVVIQSYRGDRFLVTDPYLRAVLIGEAYERQAPWIYSAHASLNQNLFTVYPYNGRIRSTIHWRAMAVGKVLIWKNEDLYKRVPGYFVLAQTPEWQKNRQVLARLLDVYHLPSLSGEERWQAKNAFKRVLWILDEMAERLSVEVLDRNEPVNELAQKAGRELMNTYQYVYFLDLAQTMARKHLGETAFCADMFVY